MHDLKLSEHATCMVPKGILQKWGSVSGGFSVVRFGSCLGSLVQELDAAILYANQADESSLEYLSGPVQVRSGTLTGYVPVSCKWKGFDESLFGCVCVHMGVSENRGP